MHLVGTYILEYYYDARTHEREMQVHILAKTEENNETFRHIGLAKKWCVCVCVCVRV